MATTSWLTNKMQPTEHVKRNQKKNRRHGTKIKLIIKPNFICKYTHLGITANTTFFVQTIYQTIKSRRIQYEIDTLQNGNIKTNWTLNFVRIDNSVETSRFDSISFEPIRNSWFWNHSTNCDPIRWDEEKAPKLNNKMNRMRIRMKKKMINYFGGIV